MAVRYSPIAICVAILALMGVTRPAFTQTRILPATLGELVLRRSLEGEEARSRLNRMHDKDVVPEQSLVGEYEGAGHHGTLYVSRYALPSQAKKTDDQMALRIKRGSRIFRAYTGSNSGSIRLSRCVGMGQTHYFFHLKTNVYWLAIDASVGEVTLRALLADVRNQ